MFDDDMPLKGTASESGFQNLEFMSISDIECYIETLKAEIERAQADIVKKKASAEAADSVFKD